MRMFVLPPHTCVRLPWEYMCMYDHMYIILLWYVCGGME